MGIFSEVVFFSEVKKLKKLRQMFRIWKFTGFKTPILSILSD